MTGEELLSSYAREKESREGAIETAKILFNFLDYITDDDYNLHVFKEACERFMPVMDGIYATLLNTTYCLDEAVRLLEKRGGA